MNGNESKPLRGERQATTQTPRGRHSLSLRALPPFRGERARMGDPGAGPALMFPARTATKEAATALARSSGTPRQPLYIVWQTAVHYCRGSSRCRKRSMGQKEVPDWMLG